MKLTFKMIITLSIITMCSAAVLSGINRWAEPRIEQHAQDARQEAIFSLHPEAKDSTQLAEYGEENLPIYSALDKDGRVVGYTFVAAGTGYQGEIRMMVGLKKSLEELAGLAILKQVETPGLGARIEEKAEDPENKEDYKFR
ncbi:MAG: FMN-binding protein, partial [bacterium]